MKVAQINLPKTAIDFLISLGYVTLYPPQENSVKAGLLEGKSILVSAPTASGKTLIAMLAIINHLFNKTGKIIYLSPLRALASEKFSEFKKLEELEEERMYFDLGDMPMEQGFGSCNQYHRIISVSHLG